MLAVLAAASACGPGRLVRHGAVNAELVTQVRQRLVAARGLDFTRPVPTRALAPADVSAAVGDELARSLSPEDRTRAELVYAHLALVPPGTQLEPAMQRLFTTQLAAFYDPRTGSLAVATGAVDAGGPALRVLMAVTGRDLVGELVVAHELTHALQDQHWGLPTDAEPATATDTDRILARRALLEGDATWASFATVAGGRLDDDTRARVLVQLDGLRGQLATSVPDVPPLLRDMLAFQYRDGTRFVDQLLARGGWPAVDRAEADPPTSSEQVLHPERYLAAARDTPTPLDVTGTASLARAGFEPILADTLGEAVIRILASWTLPPVEAGRVADGWDGDRLVTFVRGTDLVIVWMTAWDTVTDAIEFAGALPRMIPDIHVERRGTRVLALLGPWPDALPAAVWASLKRAGNDRRTPRRPVRRARASSGARAP